MATSEESPDSRWQGCRVTPGGGNPRESATEKRLPLFAEVMVKRWGKSPPRDWQQDRHGKPHPEQCQIGASRGGRSWISVRDTARRDANAREARVGSLTAVVTRLAEEWSSSPGSRSGVDKIRLTGSPRISLCSNIPAGGNLRALPAPLRAGKVRQRLCAPLRALILMGVRQVSLLTPPSPWLKGRLLGIRRGPSGRPMQEKRPWQSPPPSRSA